MKDILILGAGGFAKEIHFLIREIGGYNIIGFVHEKPTSSIYVDKIEYTVFNEFELENIKSDTCIAIGIGEPKIIQKTVCFLKDKFHFPNLIHPSVIADWKNIKIGQGNILTAKVMLTTNIELGSFNIFNLSCTIGHDVTIGNCNVFNPRVNISGGVNIGNNSFIGSNATILQYIKIEDNVIIGASSFVNNDVEYSNTVAGVPAKKIISTRKREVHSIYSKLILTTKNKKEWLNYLKILSRDTKVDIYFTPEYLHLQEQNYNAEAECFIFQVGNQIIIYTYLKFKINTDKYELDKQYFDIESPYGYNGPISNSNNKDFIFEFYKVFETYCIENNIIAEFVRYHPLINNVNINNGNIMKNLDRNTVFIDLNVNYSQIWNHVYDSKNRNTIKKAILNGLKSEIISNPNNSEILCFSEMYNETMNKLNANKYYYFSIDFIDKTFKLQPKNAFLINIKNSTDEIVCSGIFFHYGDFFHYHLSARNIISDGTSNNFLIDQALLFAQKIGAKKFHLGGGRTNHQDDTLLKFKKSFSKQIADFYIGKKIHNQKVYDKIISKWEELNPEKIYNYKNVILKYKF
jgi:sugar O-acyltransferase (sialic acid O-acetyltransferase NeuD family)